MVVRRTSWINRIEEGWKHYSIVWMSGVRRTGKTVLAKSLKHVEYFDCELRSTRNRLNDTEGFLHSLAPSRIVIDEIHRLNDPSELLKVAADHFPRIRIIATGSSTLAATRKFRDTLTGRRSTIWLTPMTHQDQVEFDRPDLAHRILHGGLPPFFQSSAPDERAYQDWLEEFWARDIEELFRLRRRDSFTRFFELLLARSGTMMELSAYAGPCEVDRKTIANYLAILQTTHTGHVIRPYSSRRAVEIVAAPKVYAMDTGFVCLHRGWRTLPATERGLLWEHLVLNELHATVHTRRIHYWRDKGGHEVDFVIARLGAPPLAIECKWTAREFDPRGLHAFANAYPGSELILVAADQVGKNILETGDRKVTAVSIDRIASHVAALAPSLTVW